MGKDKGKVKPLRVIKSILWTEDEKIKMSTTCQKKKRKKREKNE